MTAQKIDPILDGKSFVLKGMKGFYNNTGPPQVIEEPSELFEKKDDYYILKSGYMERIDENKIHQRVGPVILNGSSFIAVNGLCDSRGRKLTFAGPLATSTMCQVDRDTVQVIAWYR